MLNKRTNGGHFKPGNTVFYFTLIKNCQWQQLSENFPTNVHVPMYKNKTVPTCHFDEDFDSNKQPGK